jgi:hypothetical protein
LGDGRYLARVDDAESVLVLQTLGAPPPPSRRRRRARRTEPDASPAPLALTRVTAVRAFAPFDEQDEASRWLDEAVEAADTSDTLLAEGIGLLNRALHAQAVAAADCHECALTPERAAAVRLGYGSGEEVADGAYREAREVDVRSAVSSRRHQREEALRPQERVAAVLGGRERLDACETLLLRARADLDAGREREAALQLRVGLEALLAELRGALADPGHEEDVDTLDGRRQEAGEAANSALRGDLGADSSRRVRELLEICERVVRRRRVLRD